MICYRKAYVAYKPVTRLGRAVHQWLPLCYTVKESRSYVAQ